MTDDEIRQTVEDLYQGVLGRAPDPDGGSAAAATIAQEGDRGVARVLRRMIASEEAKRRRARETAVPHARIAAGAEIDDYRFRIPQQLVRPEQRARRILLVGSCLMDHWPQHLAAHEPSLQIERITFNNASALPEVSAEEIARYDFQIVQLPLRSMLSEPMYYGLKHDDLPGWEAAFGRAVDLLRLNLEAALAYNRTFGIRTFVLNIAAPQQNPMGRLQPRYELNNLVFFIEQLNRRLYELVAGHADAHVVDLDQIAATYGRKYLQDDAYSSTNHGSVIMPGVGAIDAMRLEPLGDLGTLYGPQVGKIVAAVYEEAKAADRTLRQQDAIKLVIFDLDDTLWRGVVAEAEDVGPDLTEGWPLGVVEAAATLWRRGVLIAIVSKNDEERTRANWQALYGRAFPMENFVSVKIGWQPKAQAIADILREVNLLPGNVLFVDDNPVERAGVSSAFPEMRTLGGAAIEWRRILLWSAETQTGGVTRESSARTEMIQAQIRRGSEESTMDRASFLASLGLALDIRRIEATGDAQFARALELLNKTNQFNTTGRRWSQGELAEMFVRGGYLLAASASDRFVDYGLIAVAIVTNDEIVQYVMSCRVFGMEVEQAVIGSTVAMMTSDGVGTIRARVNVTEKNRLALPLFGQNGFADQGNGLWTRAAGTPPLPGHIRVSA